MINRRIEHARTGFARMATIGAIPFLILFGAVLWLEGPVTLASVRFGGLVLLAYVLFLVPLSVWWMIQLRWPVPEEEPHAFTASVLEAAKTKFASSLEGMFEDDRMRQGGDRRG